MKHLLWIIPLGWTATSFVAAYFSTRMFGKPKPSPVRALCSLCLQFHDGHGTVCEACEFAYHPDGVTQWQIQDQIDGIRYWTPDGM